MVPLIEVKKQVTALYMFLCFCFFQCFYLKNVVQYDYFSIFYSFTGAGFVLTLSNTGKLLLETICSEFTNCFCFVLFFAVVVFKEEWFILNVLGTDVDLCWIYIAFFFFPAEICAEE